ncbi:MAG: hypothetical protein AAGB31_12520, partial [Bdellovibrio sp.]
AYTDYEGYYDREYICKTYTDYERRCHTVRECGKEANVGIQATVNPEDVISRERPPGVGPEPYPGNGGGGVRPDPRPEPRPPVCRDREVCENHPVSRQRCDWEQVYKTRPVTRYRTVTKYRKEARTRTVTRYREEQRCCETRYRDVFDRQWGLQVQVQFPAGVELLNNETETFKIDLAGTEAAPDVVLTPVSTIFGYKILSKQINKGVATIVLGQIPRYKADDLKEKSLQAFVATPTREGLNYSFLDNGLLPRISSQHQLVVIETATQEVVVQTELQSTADRSNSGSLLINWDYSRDYQVILKVQRQGTVIEGQAVQFEVVKPLSMVLDIGALKDEKRIKPSLRGTLNNVQVLVKDETVPYASVNTRYYITLVRKNALGKNVVLAEKGFSRTALQEGADGFYAMNIKDFGISSSDISNYLKAGSKVQVVVQVDRVTPDGQKIQFWQSANVEVR